MASSAVSSVMGKPFNAGSCFCFLSFAAGIAAVAGTSTPKDNTQAIDKNAASQALGRRETVATWAWLEFFGSTSFAWLGFIRAPYKINPTGRGKLHAQLALCRMRPFRKELKNNVEQGYADGTNEAINIRWAKKRFTSRRSRRCDLELCCRLRLRLASPGSSCRASSLSH